MRGKVNSVSGDNIKFIEKEYNSATVYNKGDTASIRGVLYSCLVNNTTGTLNMDRWKRVYLSDLAEVTSSEQTLADMVDEVYDPSKTYNKDDTALYNEVLYICKNDGTTGKWNADLWEQTTLVSILNSNLGNITLPYNIARYCETGINFITTALEKGKYIVHGFTSHSSIADGIYVDDVYIGRTNTNIGETVKSTNGQIKILDIATYGSSTQCVSIVCELNVTSDNPTNSVFRCQNASNHTGGWTVMIAKIN